MKKLLLALICIFGVTSAQAQKASSGYALIPSVNMNCPTGDSTACNSIAIGNNVMRFLNAGAAAYGNTIVGSGGMSTGTLTTAAIKNSGIGVNILAANTSGTQNTAIGWGALAANTSGSNNTGVGAAVGGTCATGSGNIIVGVDSSADCGSSSTANTAKFKGTGTAFISVTGLDTTAPTITTGGPLIYAGTKFTIATCGDTAVGGAAAGTFQSTTTGSCVSVITIAGATGATAPNGWSCDCADTTTVPALFTGQCTQTATSATTVTLTTTTVDNDVIRFKCVAY